MPHFRPHTMKLGVRGLFVSLGLLGLLSFAGAVAVGSMALTGAELWDAISGHSSGLNHAVVWKLRVPRAGGAFVTGALLGLAGALMQVLLRNPLADPYVLGVSGGAAVAALFTMWLGLGATWTHVGAFAGALASTWLLLGLAHGAGSWSGPRLLLTGVVLASGWAALISFILAVSPLAGLRGMLFWLMGDLSYSTAPGAAFAVLIAALLASLALARQLNVLAHGELQAGALGVAVGPLRLAVYLLTSLLTATAVSLAGTVGFVGLLVPHLLRLIAGSDHRLLLPGSALLGGSLLLLADTLARTLLAPQQLPVGVVTALIGVPAFLILLHRTP